MHVKSDIIGEMMQKKTSPVCIYMKEGRLPKLACNSLCVTLTTNLFHFIIPIMECQMIFYVHTHTCV